MGLCCGGSATGGAPEWGGGCQMQLPAPAQVSCTKSMGGSAGRERQSEEVEPEPRPEQLLPLRKEFSARHPRLCCRLPKGGTLRSPRTLPGEAVGRPCSSPPPGSCPCLSIWGCSKRTPPHRQLYSRPSPGGGHSHVPPAGTTLAQATCCSRGSAPTGPSYELGWGDGAYTPPPATLALTLTREGRGSARGQCGKGGLLPFRIKREALRDT